MTANPPRDVERERGSQAGEGEGEEEYGDVPIVVAHYKTWTGMNQNSEFRRSDREAEDKEYWLGRTNPHPVYHEYLDEDNHKCLQCVEKVSLAFGACVARHVR